MFKFVTNSSKYLLLPGLVLSLAATVVTGEAKPLVEISSNEERSAQQHWSPFRCLSAAIYFEARSEPLAGQRAVGQVILNRVRGAAHPDTVCGVVYQNTGKKHRCQFSFACDGRPERFGEVKAYLTAQRVARDLLACVRQCDTERRNADPIANSTHYHSVSVAPAWAGTLLRTGTIGRHVFYTQIATARARYHGGSYPFPPR